MLGGDRARLFEPVLTHVLHDGVRPGKPDNFAPGLLVTVADGRKRPALARPRLAGDHGETAISRRVVDSLCLLVIALVRERGVSGPLGA